MGSADRRNKKRKGKRVHWSKKCSATRKESSVQDTTGIPDITDSGETEVEKSSVCEPDDSETSSSSAKKLKLNISHLDEQKQKAHVDNPECYVLINTDIIRDIINLIGICPDCRSSSSVYVDHKLTSKRGLAHFLIIRCSDCSWEKQFCTSKEIDTTDDNHDCPTSVRGRKMLDVNARVCVAFREMGKGLSSIEKFCMLMNIPPPMTLKAYQNIVRKLHPAYTEASNKSMQLAALSSLCNEGTSPDADGVKEVTVSVDGSWQRRGYASLNGVITVISNGKCIDTQTMSKNCKSCSYWDKRKTIPGYDEWLATHHCVLNHKGSAGSMESAGALEIFKRSVDLHRLRYTVYRGDGDSKSYKDMVNYDPYPGYTIVKSECVGHVQKRVGARLRSLKQSYKGKLLVDKKRFTGVGRMTDKVINTLQNYYGMCIRQNKGDLYGMKKSVASLIHHCSEDDNDDNRHKYCPATGDSWCKYQADKINNTSTYKKSINIPKAISDIIMPIFSWKDLGSDSLLEKCLHGETQNANESFNNVIWTKCPKNVYVGRKMLEIGVASAVLHFNDGGKGLLEVYKNLKLSTGYFVFEGLAKTDKLRVKMMNIKASEKGRHQKKKLRAKRKGFQDKNAEDEGTVYGKGNFDVFYIYLTLRAFFMFLDF